VEGSRALTDLVVCPSVRQMPNF